ncbi:MAG: hypothetical protein KAQ64_02730 [Candidatus Pacebacteria bacterium]|nr:hypothetical protein [Candidatus Paceibacterota bacterium]
MEGRNKDFFSRDTSSTAREKEVKGRRDRSSASGLEENSSLELSSKIKNFILIAGFCLLFCLMFFVSMPVFKWVIFAVLALYILSGDSAKEVITKLETMGSHKGKLNILEQAILFTNFIGILLGLKISRFATSLFAILFLIMAGITGKVIGLILLAIFLVSLALAIWIYLKKNIVTIKAGDKGPVEVGLLRVMKKRIPVVFGEGDALTFPPFITIDPIDVSGRTLDIDPVEIISKDGVTGIFKNVSAIWSPDDDPFELMNFINFNGEINIHDALEDLIPSLLADFAKLCEMEALRITSSADIERFVLSKLTGVKKDLIEAEKRKPGNQRGIPVVDLFGALIKKITTGKLEPSKEYLEAIERAAEEIPQRREQKFDMETLRILINTVKGRSEDAEVPDNEIDSLMTVLKVYEKSPEDLGTQVLHARIANIFEPQFVEKMVDKLISSLSKR